MAEAALKQFQREHWRYRRGSYKRRTNTVVDGALNGESRTARRRQPRKTVAQNEDEEWGQGNEAAEMKVVMPHERLQELGEENRRLDAIIARHVYRVVKGSHSDGYASSQSILTTNKMNIAELEDEKMRLDISIVHQAQNVVRRTRSLFFSAEGTIYHHQLLDQTKGRRSNDGLEKAISSHNELTRNAPVTRLARQDKYDKSKEIFDVGIKHSWKVETIETEQYESNAAVTKVDIFTSHGGEKRDVREWDGDKNAHNVTVLSAGGTSTNQISDSLHDYLVKKRLETKKHHSRAVSIPEARAALTCLKSFFRHKDRTQEISELKTKFDNLVEEELFNRLKDENEVLDVAVGHAIKRSRYGEAWSVMPQ